MAIHILSHFMRICRIGIRSSDAFATVFFSWKNVSPINKNYNTSKRFVSESKNTFVNMRQKMLICENEAMTNSTSTNTDGVDMAKSSYWVNNGSEPLKNLTIGRLVDESFRKYENRTAISVHQGSRLTFKQSYEMIENFASGLIALGLEKGDHIGIWAPNIIEWYISALAIMKAGFIAVNLNPFYECPELEWALKNMDVKALIIGDTINERNFYNMIETIIPNISNYETDCPIDCENLPLLKYLIVASNSRSRGAYRWCDISSMGTHHHREKLQKIGKEINVHDICNIQFTSGTTGTSKGACLSHYNIVNNSYFTAKRMLLLEKPHSICLQVPFFHTFGTVVGILIHCHSGATLVLPSLKFSPNKSIEAIIAEKCTVLYGTPTMYNDLISVVQKKSATDPSVYSKLSSLETALTAGAICNPDLFKKMKRIFNFKHILSGYGMTEVSPIHFLSKPDDDETLVTTTIGYPLDHSEAKVISEDGRMVPFGMPGECCFKGYNTMKGYYNDPQKTNDAFMDDGWLRSGDRFILLENGYGQVVGRIKDTIIRGGENIEPVEIENVLIEHPEIENVQVYGVSDERLGEVVAASIIRIESSCLNEDDVRMFCKGKFASYKIPKYIKFVDEFQKSATGKVQKIRLRDTLERELGLKKNT